MSQQAMLVEIHDPEQRAVARKAAGAASGLPVRLSGLSKRFGAREVLRDLSLDIAPGEFLALVGRSGCGKSTLLRLLAGLDTPDRGSLSIGGGSATEGRAATRIMYQEARLLPWKRVIENVALGLPASQHPRVRAVLDKVGLLDRAEDWPAALSGGQRQRVALARALVHRPRLLLLDEPLGALDALTRIEMHTLIEDLWQSQGFTAVLVTHDVSEAVALADRVVLLDGGRISLDTAVDLSRPRSRGSPAFALLEDRVLQEVLERPGSGTGTALRA